MSPEAIERNEGTAGVDMGQPGRDFDIIVIGDCNPDIVMRGDDVRPEFGQHEKLVPDAALVIGGSGSITACACARLGLRTRLIGATGDDLFGRFMLGQLREWGVDTTLCPVLSGISTGFSVVLSNGADRAILTHTGAIDSLRLADVPKEELALARHVHVSSYFLQPRLAPQLPGVIGLLRAAGVSISLDPNWDPVGSWDNGLASLLGSVDVFLPNAAEARAITGIEDVRSAALQLARHGNLVVVKDGENGCIAARGSSISTQPVFAVPCLDTTGAGDAFDAGFLRGWLAGLPLPDCLAYGCGAGALSTRSIGATGALPTIDELTATITAAGETARWEDSGRLSGPR
jgi:sugar/nucleoside kinase (ribokinase family)